MNRRGVKIKKLPLAVSLVVLVFTFVCIFLISWVKGYYIKSGVDEALLHSGFRGLSIVIGLLGTFVAVVIAIVSDEMYNRDSLTQVANAQKLMLFVVRKSIFHQIGNYTSIFINIKDYKYVNDKYGKDIGDLVLREYAMSIMHFLGKKNYIGRLGGDNFLILVRNNEAENAIAYIKTVPVKLLINGEELNIQVNSRAGAYRIQATDNYGDILGHTGMAIDYAKRSHRDFVWYTKETEEVILYEKRLLSEFERAVFEDEFFVKYQPKVNLKTKKVCGAEALVEWNKNGEKRNTEDIINLLEKYNKVSELDFYVLRTVCADIKDWLDQGFEAVPVSVNFSKLHLENESFAPQVLSVIEHSDIPYKYIEIEITESLSIDDLSRLEAFTGLMHQKGIKVAIDDFGKGYSSLSMLDRLCFDIVKMDKAFLVGVENKKHKRFVNQIVQMLKSLDFEVVCEGVESEEQQMVLEIAGCDIGQGYLYGRNLSKEEFMKKL